MNPVQVAMRPASLNPTNKPIGEPAQRGHRLDEKKTTEREVTMSRQKRSNKVQTFPQNHKHPENNGQTNR